METSFRLNVNNQREVEALNVIQQWLRQGLRTHHAITEALLKLDSSSSQEYENRALNDLSKEIKNFKMGFETGTSFMMPNGEVSSKEKLSDGFVTSIIKSAKPGLRAEA